ncbi:hypothetical protein [uncultured Methanospirillum sp.]|uniref:hypothetical protein n=1 Tax=uncultured Methanospirillum sp. TaxID=262503 RepID=UPI0029C7B59B|nr:hypothetical protein [uncultured Methanospirillum sp.]
MSEVASKPPMFTDLALDALRMAKGRSLAKVKESGAYLIKRVPDKKGDLFSEFWDIAVYSLIKQKKSEDVISLLSTRNKQLGPDLELSYGKLQEIKELAYSFITVSKRDDPPEKSEEEEQQRHLPFFEKDRKLFLTCITPNETFQYAHLEGNNVVFSNQELDPKGVISTPPELPVHQDRGTTVFVVGLPKTDLLTKAREVSPDELFSRMKNHFYKYTDAPEVDYEVFVYFCLYSWFYSKCGTAPYLRFLGDTGKGKSRFLKVTSDLCFYPIKASGSSSLSGIMRFKERWMGTLLIDESDLKGDQADPLIKYLNLGFERDNFFILTDKNDVGKSHIFDPFGPKIIAMRQPFRDVATEGRCLSFSPNETARDDIPSELPTAYYNEVEDLRVLIARFTLNHWHDVDESCMISCVGMDIEPRLKQMARPLSIILKLFPDGEERFKNYLNVRQKEIKQTRAESWEGGMFNYALQLALGEEDLMIDPEFGRYYNEGKIQCVLPKMIAESLKISPKAVTRALEGIGMEVRQRRVTVCSKSGTSSKKVRPLTVPNKQKWKEMTQRYYLIDTEGNLPPCPDCLRGPEYNTRQNDLSDTDAAVQSSSSESNNGLPSDQNGTHVPDVPHTGDTRQSFHDSRKGEDQEDSDHSGTLVPVVPHTGDRPPTYQKWITYHGLPKDTIPSDFSQIQNTSELHGQKCHCKGCLDPERSNPIFWNTKLPEYARSRICLVHYNEMMALWKAEQGSDEKYD